MGVARLHQALGLKPPPMGDSGVRELGQVADVAAVAKEAWGVPMLAYTAYVRMGEESREKGTAGDDPSAN